MNATKIEPWYVGVQNDGLFIIDKPPSPSGTDVVWEGRQDLKVIAVVEDAATFDETSRNANLLAAAPDLLMVLKEILADGELRELMHEPDCYEHQSTLGRAKDAVMKAEGKA